MTSKAMDEIEQRVRQLESQLIRTRKLYQEVRKHRLQLEQELLDKWDDLNKQYQACFKNNEDKV